MYYDPIGNLLGTWAMGDGLWTIALRLLLALLFGAVLGCERAAKRHAAGLRTFVLVCLSGTAAMPLGCRATMPPHHNTRKVIMNTVFLIPSTAHRGQ